MFLPWGKMVAVGQIEVVLVTDYSLVDEAMKS